MTCPWDWVETLVMLSPSREKTPCWLLTTFVVELTSGFRVWGIILFKQYFWSWIPVCLNSWALSVDLCSYSPSQKCRRIFAKAWKKWAHQWTNTKLNLFFAVEAQLKFRAERGLDWRESHIDFRRSFFLGDSLCFGNWKKISLVSHHLS